MSLFSWVEVEVDEAMAAASEQIAAAQAVAAEQGLFGIGTGWAVLIGVVILAVAIMLLILAGQQRRREREDAGEAMAFGDEYAIRDEEHEDAFDDSFATVEIEERPAPAFEEEEPPFIAEETFEEEPAPEPARAENVVPIRNREPEQRAPAADYPDNSPSTSQRYAFAAAGGGAGTGGGLVGRSGGPESPLARRSTGASAAYENTFRRSDPYQERSMTSDEYNMARSGEGGGGGGRGSDDDTPYIAPFIREDIERAERRQAERINGLKDEVARQFRTMQNENASRLDLFVATVDRKLDSLEGRGGGYGAQGDLEIQRAAETAVRPVHERLSRLAEQMEAQDRRLAEMTHILHEHLIDLPRLGDRFETASADIARLLERANEGSDTNEQVRAEIGALFTGLDELKEGMERVERAILERAAQDGSSSVALTEVVRGTLPEGSYEFHKRLSTGKSVDCLISFEGLDEKVAIDAGFPMEAFNALPSRDAVRKNLPQARAAEDTFRRAILRAILEAADRCIVPGETTDSCLLFLPSEAAYTILHDRFGDLVRDAQRARVWLTSPSTLMGTLNLLGNLMPRKRRAPGKDAAAAAPVEDSLKQVEQRAEDERREREREAERRAMREEIKALRKRASSLSGELDRTRGALSELIETTDRLSARGGDDEGDAALARAQPRRPEPRQEEERQAYKEPQDDWRRSAPFHLELPGRDPRFEEDEDQGPSSYRFAGTPEWSEDDREDRFDEDED